MAIGETTIKIRRDTAANWTTKNPILAQGEMGYETDTGYLKIGTGSLNWEDLDYFTGPVDTTITTATATDLDGLLAGDGSTVYSLPLTTYQPLDSDLTAIAALSTTSFGRASAAAGRSALGLGSASLLDASNVPLLNAANTFTVGGQVISTAAGVVGLSIDAAATPTADPIRVRRDGTTLVAIRPNAVTGNDASPMRLVFDSPAGGVGGSWGWNDALFALTARNATNTGYAATTAAGYYAGGMGVTASAVSHTDGSFELAEQGWRGVDRVLSLSSTSGVSWTSGAASGTATTRLNQATAGNLRLSRLGTNGSSSVLSFAGPSSLGTVRDVGVITSSYATATDASFQGQLSLGVRGIVGATDTLQTGLTMTAQSDGSAYTTVFAKAGFQFNSVDMGPFGVTPSWDGSGIWTLGPETSQYRIRFSSTTISTAPTTVAALPSAATAGEGARAFVTDADSTTFNAAAVGGGSNKVPVFSNGTAWFVG
jgi:hypothetical protein